jgi:hypothetical protein
MPMALNCRKTPSKSSPNNWRQFVFVNLLLLFFKSRIFNSIQVKLHKQYIADGGQEGVKKIEADIVSAEKELEALTKGKK